MTKKVKVVRPNSSVKEVAAHMNKFNVGSIIVVEGGKPIGIISERDILRKVVEPCLRPEILTAEQIMTSPVVTIDENATINEAAKLMAEKKVRKIPAMNKQELVGIVTFTDIVTKVLTTFSILEELVNPQHSRVDTRSSGKDVSP
jgi:CBS domain-containing protein